MCGVRVPQLYSITFATQICVSPSRIIRMNDHTRPGRDSEEPESDHRTNVSKNRESRERPRDGAKNDLEKHVTHKD
jgi:hypothetical protein